MTNEQIKAKELAELLTAFADGKQFEYKAFDNELWEDFLEPTIKRISSIPIDRLRIKPETRRVPLTKEDLVERIKNNQTLLIIDKQFQTIHNFEYILDDCVRYFGYIEPIEFIDLMSYSFADGTPCYKEVNNE